MKPIVVYTDKSDTIKLTKEEFEKYINEAYDQGYNRGYADGSKTWWSPIRYDTTPCPTNTPTITTPIYTPIITCNTDHTISGELANTIGDKK